MEACEVANFDPRDKPLVAYGGVLVHNSKFRNLILEHINRDFNYSFKYIMPGSSGAMRPVFGALLFALGNSKTGDLRIPSEEIIDRLVHDQITRHQKGELSND